MFQPPPIANDILQDPIRLADWVELNLLTGEEFVMSVDSVTAELAGDPPDEAVDSESRSPYDDPQDPNGQLRLGYWNVAEDHTVDAFAELASRAGWLEDRYPVNVGGDTVQLNQDTVTCDIYRFLVLLRARQLYRNALGDDGQVSGLLFEELVKYALGAYVGVQPTDRVRFGVAGGSRGDGLPNRLECAVQELSRRMHEPLGQVPSGRTGDYKADAVVWKPFGDRNPGQFALIGQATMTEGDWENDEPASRWIDKQPGDSRLINFLARPMSAVAFPETLSLTPRTTLEGMSFSSIPFDRLRLLSVLHDQLLPFRLTERMRRWEDTVIRSIPK